MNHPKLDNILNILKESSTLLKEYNENRFPKLFRVLEKYNTPDICVHFSNSEFVNTNPRPVHHDPLGVYGFPIDYVKSGGLKRNQGFYNKPYIHILKAKSSAKVLNLSELTEPQAKKILSDMGIPESYLDESTTYHNSGDSVGHKFWGSMERWRVENDATKNSSWNTLFRKSGYNVLIDTGSSIIHSNEPQQMVFLEPNTFKIIDTIKKDNSNVISSFVRAFPDMKPRVSTSSFGKEKHLTLTDPSGVSINVSSYEESGFRVNIYGIVGEYYKSYDLTHPVDSAIRDTKEALSKAEPSEYTTKRKASDKIVKELLDTIAETYGLRKHKYNEGVLTRIYGQGGRKIILRMHVFESEGKPYFDMSVNRNRPYGFDNFFISSDSKEITEDNIKQVVSDSIDALLKKNEENIEQEEKRGSYDHGAEDARKFIEFLKNKVLV